MNKLISNLKSKSKGLLVYNKYSTRLLPKEKELLTSRDIERIKPYLKDNKKDILKRFELEEIKEILEVLPKDVQSPIQQLYEQPDSQQSSNSPELCSTQSTVEISEFELSGFTIAPVPIRTKSLSELSGSSKNVFRTKSVGGIDEFLEFVRKQ